MQNCFYNAQPEKRNKTQTNKQKSCSDYWIYKGINFPCRVHVARSVNEAPLYDILQIIMVALE